MPNVFKYNPSSTEAKSLRKGNFYIGVGDVGKGPTNETGFYNGVDIGTFSYVIVLHRGENVPSFYQIQNDTELIERTNQIDKSVVRTTKEQCFSYFAGQSDKMVINTEYPTYTTDQLVFHFDAGFLPSYPATGSTCYDISQGAENISLINGSLFNSFGYFMLDGINDRLGSSGVNLVDAITGTFSFSFGAIFMIPSYPPQRASDTANYSSLLMKGSYNPSFGISLIYDLPVGGVHTRVRAQPGIRNLTTSGSPGYGIESLVTSASFSLGRWYRIDFTCSNSGTTHFLKNYINGVLDSSSTATNNLYPIAIQNASDITVASSPLQGNGLTSNPTLNISQGSVYTKELSSLEILQNYYGGSIVTNGLVLALDANNLVSYDKVGNSWYNLSGSTNTGTLNNSPTFIDQNIKSFEFDGTNDYIDCQNNASLNFGTASLTVSAWYQRYDSATTNLRILAKGAGDDSTPGFALFGGNTNLTFIISDSPTRKSIGTSTSLNLNTWYYVTGVVNRASNSLSIFINGIVQNSRSDLTSTTLTGNSNLYIGANIPGSVLWKGLISGVKIYNRALSASEILQNFNAHRSRFGI